MLPPKKNCVAELEVPFLEPEWASQKQFIRLQLEDGKQIVNP